MVDRQIRYNLETDITLQELAKHHWIFLVINESTEIARIRERIYRQLKPYDDFRNLHSGEIPHSGGLCYDFFSFFSEMGKIEEPDKIYRSKKFKLDRDLVIRNDVGLEQYLKPILEGRKP